MTLLEICQWLEASSVGELVALSQYGFPILVAIHLMGLGLSAGTVVWLDLRLLGVVMPTCPVSVVYRRLAPWMLAGFVSMFISGSLLFAGFATAAYSNTFFRIKLAALLVAGVNAAAYHWFTERRIQQWDSVAPPPAGARVAGLVSISVWTIVVLAGRAMSYTMF